MIRIRRQDGSVIAVGKDAAVEMLGDDGNLALVVLTTRDKSVHVLTPGDPLFVGYCRANGLKASKVVVHEPFTGQKMGG